MKEDIFPQGSAWMNGEFINDKINSLKMTLPIPGGDTTNTPPNMMPQYSRNNSNYMELEAEAKPTQNINANPMANYFNYNFIFYL